MSESNELLSYERDESVAVLRLDDGKANALSPKVLDALHAGLDRAEEEDAEALVLIGREGKFSAGFDLSVMSQGMDAAMGMVNRGAELSLRLFESPRPVVLGVTGHALAMGAVLLLSVDERIGAQGPFKLGLNEVAIGMTLPDFALELAKERLSKRHLYRSCSAAEVYSPEGAVDAGYLDRIVSLESVAAEAIARAKVMASTLDAAAHRNTKRALRAPVVERLRQSLVTDKAKLSN